MLERTTEPKKEQKHPQGIDIQSPLLCSISVASRWLDGADLFGRRVHQTSKAMHGGSNPAL